jgi:hypothetical protein
MIGFQRVDDYRAPSWPDQTVPQQLHICFKVDEELDEAEARLLELGASKPDHQPHNEARARVLDVTRPLRSVPAPCPLLGGQTR